MITVRTLGPVAVDVDGGPAPPELLWRKHLGLLIYLARSPRLTRTREHLLGLLWSDKAESAARHSLNEALRIIRRVAGPEAVTTSVDRVTLSREVITLDVDRLEADPSATIDPDGAGEFLEGFSLPDASGFEEWLAAERRHWRNRAVTALLAEATAAVGAGRAEAGIRFAERAARIDPESESATRALIECLALAGDRAAALGCLQRLQSVLAERFGTAPGADLLALGERLRRSGGRGSRRDPVDPGSPSRRRAPLFGREAAHARLADAWQQATRGAATIAVIEGDDGLGKTRLLADFATHVAVAGGTVAMVRMVESDRDRPEAVIAGLMRDGLCDAPGVGGATAESLAAAALSESAWADRFPAARSAAPAPLADAFLDILDAIARESPLLVAVDDAHWVDPTGFMLFDRILRDHHRRPILIVLTSAPAPPRDELDRIRQRIGHDVPGASISLEPLDVRGLTALVGWTFPRYEAAAAERVARRLAADTAGYPLLAIDLLDAIAAGLELGGESAAPWPRPAGTLSHTRPGDLPDTIVAAIRVGFRRLSADAQAVLAAASLGPPRLDPDRVAAVVGLPADRLDRALDELEWHRWLTADAQGYTFVARISREVVTRDFVTSSQRRRWSAAWGGVT